MQHVHHYNTGCLETLVYTVYKYMEIVSYNEFGSSSSSLSFVIIKGTQYLKKNLIIRVAHGKLTIFMLGTLLSNDIQLIS